MPEGGALLLARKAFDSWFWSLTGDQIKIFLWLLYKARWKREADRWWDGQQFVEIRRGELVTSTEAIAKACGLGRHAVRRTLDLLQKFETISTKISAKRWTKITFINYDTYQDLASYLGQVQGQRAANSPPTGGHIRNKGNKKTRKQETTSSSSPTPPSPDPAAPPADDAGDSAHHSGSDPEMTSGSVPGNGEYVRSVVAAFLAITDASVRPSKTDLKLAAAWYEAGIPLPHVEHVFRHVALNRASGSPGKPKIRSLAYFTGEVERARLEPPDPAYCEYVADTFRELAGKGSES